MENCAVDAETVITDNTADNAADTPNLATQPTTAPAIGPPPKKCQWDDCNNYIEVSNMWKKRIKETIRFCSTWTCKVLARRQYDKKKAKKAKLSKEAEVAATPKDDLSTSRPHHHHPSPPPLITVAVRATVLSGDATGSNTTSMRDASTSTPKMEVQDASTSPHVQTYMPPPSPLNPNTSLQTWVGRSPVCPVECAGLNDKISTFNETHTSMELLDIFARQKPKKIPMLKEGTDTTCDLDISTNFQSEQYAAELGEKLRKELQISEEEKETCIKVAKVLKVNKSPCFGVYCHGHITEVHGHLLGVLNLLLSGTKVWDLWPPGPRPAKDSVAYRRIFQQAGQLLWLPPGWWHRVETTGTGPGDIKESRKRPQSINMISRADHIRVAHGFTMWCLPAQLQEYAISSYAAGASEEGQSTKNNSSRAAEVKQLYTLLVHHM